MKKTLTFLSLFILTFLFVQCEKNRNLHTPISERTLLGETPVFELQPTVVWTAVAEQQETDYFNLTHSIDELGNMVYEAETNVVSISYDETDNTIEMVVNAIVEEGAGMSFSEVVRLNLSGIDIGTYEIDGANNICLLEINIGSDTLNGELLVGSVTISETEANYIRGFYHIGDYFNSFCWTPPADVGFGVIEGDFQISF